MLNGALFLGFFPFALVNRLISLRSYGGLARPFFPPVEAKAGRASGPPRLRFGSLCVWLPHPHSIALSLSMPGVDRRHHLCKPYTRPAATLPHPPIQAGTHLRYNYTFIRSSTTILCAPDHLHSPLLAPRYLMGSAARHTGHSSLMSIQRSRQARWKRWSQGETMYSPGPATSMPL